MLYLRVMHVRFRSIFCALTLGAVTAATLAASPARAAERTAVPVQQRLVQAADDYRSGDHASAWFRFWSLAHEGHAAAQFNLGQLYREGLGVPTDLALARYWYTEAASQGHAFAQYNLGIMYERGDGTPADLVEARAWYRRAAAQEIGAARAALDRLERQGQRREGRKGGTSGLAAAGRDTLTAR